MRSNKKASMTLSTIVVVAHILILLLVVAHAAHAAQDPRHRGDYEHAIKKGVKESQLPYQQHGQTGKASTHGPTTMKWKALPSTEDEAEVKSVKALTVAGLRRYLRDRDAKCDGCIERRHLVERALQVRGWLTENERISQQLTGLQASVVNAVSPQHLASVAVPTAESGSLNAGPGALVSITTHRPQLEAVQRAYGIFCQQPMINGTQYCHRGGSPTM